MTNVKYTIYINEAPFTADMETIDAVVYALERAGSGFQYDKRTEGFIQPSYYDTDD